MSFYLLFEHNTTVQQTAAYTWREDFMPRMSKFRGSSLHWCPHSIFWGGRVVSHTAMRWQYKLYNVQWNFGHKTGAGLEPLQKLLRGKCWMVTALKRFGLLYCL